MNIKNNNHHCADLRKLLNEEHLSLINYRSLLYYYFTNLKKKSLTNSIGNVSILPQ